MTAQRGGLWDDEQAAAATAAPSRRRWGDLSGVRLFLALAMLACGGVAPAAGQSVAPDTALWRVIDQMAAEPDPLTATGEPDFKAAAERRARLAERCRQFLAAYPGAPRAFDVAQIELQALFERDCLLNTDLAELCPQVEHYLGAAFPEPVRAEAAYWRILCQRRGRADSQPASNNDVAQLDPELAAAYELYLAEFPRGRHAARLIRKLFESAEQAGDQARMDELLGRLALLEGATGLAATLEARRFRAEAVGRPFPPEWTASTAGQVALVVVADRGALRSGWLLDEIAAWAAGQADVALVLAPWSSERAGAGSTGPGPATNAARTKPASGVTASAGALANGGELGGGWRVLADSEAARFATAWRVHEAPLVFVVGRDGVLRAVTTAADWRAAAENAVQN